MERSLFLQLSFALSLLLLFLTLYAGTYEQYKPVSGANLMSKKDSIASKFNEMKQKVEAKLRAPSLLTNPRLSQGSNVGPSAGPSVVTGPSAGPSVVATGTPSAGPSVVTGPSAGPSVVASGTLSAGPSVVASSLEPTPLPVVNYSQALPYPDSLAIVKVKPSTMIIGPNPQYGSYPLYKTNDISSGWELVNINDTNPDNVHIFTSEFCNTAMKRYPNPFRQEVDLCTAYKNSQPDTRFETIYKDHLGIRFPDLLRQVYVVPGFIRVNDPNAPEEERLTLATIADVSGYQPRGRTADVDEFCADFNSYKDRQTEYYSNKDQKWYPGVDPAAIKLCADYVRTKQQIV